MKHILLFIKNKDFETRSLINILEESQSEKLEKIHNSAQFLKSYVSDHGKERNPTLCLIDIGDQKYGNSSYILRRPQKYEPFFTLKAKK